jgi:SAM-dependent methyltransferase
MTPVEHGNAVDSGADGSAGIQIEVTDPQLQAYLQRYPFAAGPEPESNRRGLETVSAGMRSRRLGRRVVPVLLKPYEAQLLGDEAARAAALMDAIGLSEEKKLVHLDDFGWEANLVPRDAKNVLVIGCGNGVELIFLRAVLPQARITAMDYYEKLLPGLQSAVGLTFHEGDIGKLLPGLKQEYDLVFSNHTMEHLYAPNAMLTTLANLLVAGGHIVSIMPMVGMEGTPFLEEVRRYTERLAADPSAKIHPLELVYFDPGHPWKTNPDDIATTLTDSGFRDVRIYQREEHRSRPLQLSAEAYRSRRRWKTRLNRIFLGVPRRALMALFPSEVPARLPVLFYALERRLPFGTNLVMNNFSEEALFLARVDR